MTRHWTKEISAKMLREFTGKVRTREMSETDDGILRSHRVYLPARQLPEIFGVTFSFLGRDIEGIGICNVNDGIEFLNNTLDNPVTIGKFGVSVIKSGASAASRECCIFSNYLDWLVYQAFTSKYIFGIKDNGAYADSYIINSPSNFLSLLIRTDTYRNLNIFMPSSDYGRVVVRTLEQRHGHSVIDCSLFYTGYRDFRDYAEQFAKRLRMSI